uniref:Alternative protein NFE2 n=1 Tax=Homo sapiens TaxID=9606 RepID=L8E770_HUMAN|nr:alternative protein NFE2 [Homo sapiens]
MLQVSHHLSPKPQLHTLDLHHPQLTAPAQSTQILASHFLHHLMSSQHPHPMSQIPHTPMATWPYQSPSH